MALWSIVARQAANVTRLSAPKSAVRAANLGQRRGLSTGGGDHHGPLDHQYLPRGVPPEMAEFTTLVHNIIGCCTYGLYLCVAYKLVKFEMKRNKEQNVEGPH
ncbi:hypothetical protein OROMI_007286 [Orobanche minor]